MSSVFTGQKMIDGLDRVVEAINEMAAREGLPAWQEVFAGCQSKAEQLVKQSPYLGSALTQNWGWVATDFAFDSWSSPLSLDDIESQWCLLEQSLSPESRLRKLRNRLMARFIWRDFSRACDAVETVAQVSLLADFCINKAHDLAFAEIESRFGTPVGRDSGRKQQLVILAMGKLGAHELNLSSDIDLIFVYPESGETEGARRSLSNQEFFIKVGQRIIGLLDTVTADGFVFRVDMRLRPYGESGSLVMNFASFESYYQDQGRDWERYAMIKARAVCGRPEDVEELRAMLKPFVFRRYIDFSVIESLRDMKRMIAEQVVRKGQQNDVKLGPGGIREIEFIGQCFQLIRGGRDESLQARDLMSVLHACEELGCLPSQAVSELREAYWFLRNTEHAIQGYQDKQTQRLPEEPSSQYALASVMGFETYEDFISTLDAYRNRVQRHFAELIAAPEDTEDGQATKFWDQLEPEQLSELGFIDSARTAANLNKLIVSPVVKSLQVEARRRLDLAMPKLLDACAGLSDPDLALERLLPLVESILRRSAYLLLLVENPSALRELVRLCAASPWIAKQLAQRPALLDELLDVDRLYHAPDKARLRHELALHLKSIPLQDLEAQMDGLRYFKAAQVLRVAASEISGVLPLMKVSDNLTFIAEVILERVLDIAWNDMVAKHGEPTIDSEGTGFCIIAYGKLGGLELNYSSDLDLVFLYDAPAQSMTRGERAIDHARFYTRLGQRIIHILETRMTLGILYEVDMRLRPSGNSGMLVASLSAFEKYQTEEAWTWEHQALSRARFVAGDPALGGEFDRVRREILARPRDRENLADEVRAMRAKMREHLDIDTKSDVFDLKQSAGGIVDIEFMVQYALLAWSHLYPSLSDWTDNVRQLESLADTGLVSTLATEDLREAYLAYRSATHDRALQELPGKVDAAQWASLREKVSARWRHWFDDNFGE